MLQTRLCSLRPWQLGDEASLVRHGNDRAVWRNMTDLFPNPYTLEDAEGWPFEKPSGQLECEGLTGTGRHDRDAVFALEDGFDDFPLAWPKIIKAEDVLKYALGVGCDHE